MDIIVENSGELPETGDVLELIRDSWRHIGIRIFARPMQLTLFRRRVFAGETVMSMDKGIENGLADAAASPHELAPTSQEQLEWPKWGQYFETKGAAGQPPSLPAAIALKNLYDGWLGSVSPQEQAEAWGKMLTIWADEVFSIGTVAGVLQPVVISDRLHNIPAKGIYNWNPGAYFGIYKPDQFWLEETAPQKSASAAPEQQ
jgi:peptide/nickel transport system substrate-binding protein